MSIVWLALLSGLGVLFGMASLVMDVGYGTGQVRAMQNGADAAVMAATRLLAESVTTGPGNPPTLIYGGTNGQVHNKAREFAFYNHPAGLASSDYEHIAVEYMPCSGASPSPNWTYSSDWQIVNEVLGSATETSTVRVRRQASAAAAPPAWTCKLRVFTRVMHHALFASALGHGNVGETSRATAAISGTNLPSVFTNVWPITRWECNCSNDRVNSSDGCDDQSPGDVNEAPCQSDPTTNKKCTFWDSQSDPQGSFKHYVDMSHYSGLAKSDSPPELTRNQHLNGWSDANRYDPPPPDVQYDTTHPGSNDRINDVPHWVRHSWKGGVRIVSDDPLCTNPSLNDTSSTAGVVRDCTNSRVETFRQTAGQGDLGQNIAGAMRDYIDMNKGGNADDLCHFGGSNNSDNDYATVTVFFWRYGEQDTVSGNNSMALSDESRIWGHFSDQFPDQENELKRIVISKAARFRFCRGDVASASVRSYFVAFVDPSQPPTGNPPSTVANTVALTD
jgi:hypothetical protein